MLNRQKKLIVISLLVVIFAISNLGGYKEQDKQTAAVQEYDLENVVYSAQKKLKELGFYNGKINGSFGLKTRAAIFKYQKESIYLENTGKLDAQTQEFLLGIKLYNKDEEYSVKSGGGNSTVCDVMYMAGGHQYHYLDDFYFFDGLEWVQNPTPPWSGRGYPVFLTFQEKIWIMGGSGDVPVNGRTNYNDVWVYDPQVGIWEEFDNDIITPGIQPAPWNPSSHFDGVVYDGKIWLIDRGSGILWNFDGTTWTDFDSNILLFGTQSVPFFPDSGYELTVFDGKIWKTGGNNPYNASNDVWSFDAVEWTQHPDAPWIERWEHETTVYDGKIWLMGGYLRGSGRHDVWTFDGTTWTEFDNDPNTFGTQLAPWSGRWEFAVQVYQDKLWVIAGSSPFKNDVWYLDTTTYEWTEFDHDINTSQIEHAPWPARDGLMLLSVPCTDLGLGSGDLSINKTVDNSNIVNGEATYTIIVENLGDVATRDVVVIDNLPQGISYLSHTNPPGTTFLQLLPSNDISFEIPILQPLEVMEFTITVSVHPQCDVYVNEASVSFNGSDINPGNNTTSVDLYARKPIVTNPSGPKSIKSKIDIGQAKIGWSCVTDLGITKEVSSVSGRHATFLMTLTNYGPNNSLFWVTDNLPAGVNFVSGTSNNRDITVSLSGNTVLFTGDIDNGEVIELYLRVSSPRSGIEFVNSVNVTGTYIGPSNDSNPSNNTDSVNIIIPSIGRNPFRVK